jgi:flavin-dependent dehydrogenase
MLEQSDALILGGGPAGSAAALLLARAGWSVVLLERQRFPRRKVCGEYLSGTNRPLFAALGLLDFFDHSAGPEVTRVGLFARGGEVHAELPKPRHGWGRALSRDRLDAFLLDRAAAAGAHVVQPNVAELLQRDGDQWVCRGRPTGSWRAPIVIAAHGSWEAGGLPTQPPRVKPRADDLFGFKAHFRAADLDAGLMPLLAFPGGYGGMVHANDGLVSLSCCVRRDRLAALRTDGHSEAGPAVEAHIRRSCAAVERVLAPATRVGSWLAAGPIRPGARLRWPPGIFAVGNAAGEAHPVIAEGISMAMQSSWLLTKRLIASRATSPGRESLASVALDYARDWRRAFRRRLIASTVVARWAMSPAAMQISLPIVGQFPAILTWGALVSGKVARVVRPARSSLIASAAS